MQIQYKAMTNVYCISTAQAGMFAVLCLLGVRSRPARNLLLLSPAAVSFAGLLYWAPPAARAEAGQRQGQGTPGGFPWSRARPAEHQLASSATAAAAGQPRHPGAAPPSPPPTQADAYMLCTLPTLLCCVLLMTDTSQVPTVHCPSHWYSRSICRWRWC